MYSQFRAVWQVSLAYYCTVVYRRLKRIRDILEDKTDVTLGKVAYEIGLQA